LNVPAKPRFRLKLVWLFGLVRRDITGGKKREKKGKSEKIPEPKRKRTGLRDTLAILRTSGLVRQVIRLGRDVLSRLQIKDLAADLKVGLGSPMATGLLFAALGPLASWLNASFPVQVRASFAHEATLEGYLQGAVRVQPIRMVFPCLRFIFSPPAFRVARKLIRAKWKRKR
jgi:hypothetical protein